MSEDCYGMHTVAKQAFLTIHFSLLQQALFHKIEKRCGEYSLVKADIEITAQSRIALEMESQGRSTLHGRMTLLAQSDYVAIAKFAPISK